MDIIETAKERKSVKIFDTSKNLTEQELSKVKELLRLAPSSVNSQPWHFFIASSIEDKEKIVKSCQGMYSVNVSKVTEASAVVVFCAKKNLDFDYLKKVTLKEKEDGRFKKQEFFDAQLDAYKNFINLHENVLYDTPIWIQKQVYLNLGFFLLGTAAMGIESIAMEGFEPKILDKELDLEEMGLTSMVLVALGKHSSEDFNAVLPKSRLEEENIITML